MNQAIEFKDYIRIIGRGQRAGRTLTQQQAFDAMSMLITGQITAEQKGAFLMLLRVREETAEELAGFTQAFRQHSLAGLPALSVDLDLGCYAGKRRHLPWFLLAVLLLTQRGKRIFLHGTHEPDSKRLYLSEVLPLLGFSVASNLSMATKHMDSHGFCYMPLDKINPALDEVIQLRGQFGLRSCANTLARMLNPSQAKASLQGVFHRDVDKKHSNTAALLNDANVLCFRGEGGEIEYNPERDVSLYISRQGQQQSIDLDATNKAWVSKPKALVAQQLITVWEGEEFPYATSAVCGTLAIMLMLLDNIDWSQAKREADEIWHGRNKTWPVQNLNVASSPPLFDTTGKHYAH